MIELLDLRADHADQDGNIFVTTLENGQKVPWRPLSIKEYIEYDKLFRSRVYPQAYLEDEIFRKCVLSEVLVEHIELMRAGYVQAVVTDILAFSGPTNAEDLQTLFNIHRHEAEGLMHQIVSVICQGFPAYKPEEVYSMDYNTLMQRLALAENKLLRTGILIEPLNFMIPEQQKQSTAPVPAQKPDIPVVPKNAKELKDIKKQDLKSQWNQQKAAEIKAINPQPPPPPTEQVIIKKADIIEHQSVMSGHDQDVVHHKQATDETAQIYSEYIEQIKSGKKIEIKTPEERMIEAEERSKKHKQELLELKDKTIKEMAEERKKLLEIREKERQRRKKRAGRNK